MPTCPGCQQSVPYDNLDTHYRYCHGLTDADERERRSVRRLETRLDDVERRLDGRIRTLEVHVGADGRAGEDVVESRPLEPDQ